MAGATETALHVLWTKPWQRRGSPRNDPPLPTPVERLVLAASALTWRWHSGPCVLFTDRLGEAILRDLDMMGLWSRVDARVLEAPVDVDPSVFWDLGKTLALQAHGAPATLLDLDLIAWRRPPRRAPVMFYHWEENEPPWYLPAGDYPTPHDYQLDPRWNWNAPSCNTAYVRVEDPDFLNAFCEESRRYAEGNRVPPDKALAAFLLSGQRLFSLVASRLRVEHAPLLPYLHSVRGEPRYLAPEMQAPFEPWSLERGLVATHLWSWKHHLRRAPAAAAAYAAAIVRRALELDAHLGRQVAAEADKLMGAAAPVATAFSRLDDDPGAPDDLGR